MPGRKASVTLYAATNLRDTQEVVAGFNQRYPFIKVAFSSLGGPGVLNKVSTEYRAGGYQADVVTLTGLYVPELIDKKILARYRSPMVPFLRKGFVDPEGYWPGIFAIGMTIIYNTRQVAAKDVPKRYEDLLAPRWKDNMIMDGEAHDLLAGLIDLWGEAKATSFLRSLATEQKVRFSRQSHTFMTQLVATGEHDLIVDGYVHNAVAFKEKRRANRFCHDKSHHYQTTIDHCDCLASAASLCSGATFGLSPLQRSERNYGEESGPVGSAQRRALERRAPG